MYKCYGKISRGCEISIIFLPKPNDRTRQNVTKQDSTRSDTDTDAILLPGVNGLFMSAREGGHNI